MVISRAQSLKMADNFCHRVDEVLQKRGIELQSQVRSMGYMRLSTRRESITHDKVVIRREIIIKDFSKWTPDKFERFEAFAIGELTK
jgi:hypothetical protein